MDLKQIFEYCVQRLNHQWEVYDGLLKEEEIDKCIFEINALVDVVNGLDRLLKVTDIMQ